MNRQEIKLTLIDFFHLVFMVGGFYLFLNILGAMGLF
jgi:hypothetical protein